MIAIATLLLWHCGFETRTDIHIYVGDVAQVIVAMWDWGAHNHNNIYLLWCGGNTQSWRCAIVIDVIVGCIYIVVCVRVFRDRSISACVELTFCIGLV